MALKTSPEQAAADWVSGLSSKTDKIRRGVEAVTVSPGQKAAAQADAWANNTLAAKEKFRRNSAAVDVASWRDQTIAAIGNVASGAQRKQAIFAQKLVPVFAHMSSGLSRLDTMPRGTYEQNKARANFWMDHMHGYQPRG